MKEKVFIDTNILLDITLARREFLELSRAVLALAENFLFMGFTSSIVVSNLYYIIRKNSNDATARIFLGKLLQFISILAVDQTDIENALKSDFKDFEDALRFAVCSKNHCEIIVTRNLDDFKSSRVLVMSPNELLKIYQELL